MNETILNNMVDKQNYINFNEFCKAHNLKPNNADSLTLYYAMVKRGK